MMRRQELLETWSEGNRVAGQHVTGTLERDWNKHIAHSHSRLTTHTHT